MAGWVAGAHSLGPGCRSSGVCSWYFQLTQGWVLGEAGAQQCPLSEPTLLSGQRFGHEVMVALYAPSEPVMDYNMVIIFIMAVGTVALGGYWAGSHDVKK